MNRIVGPTRLILLVLLASGQLLAQNSQAKSGVIEGVIVDFLNGPHEISMTVESAGKKYEFCFACRGPQPLSVGADITEANAVGMRVRVSYTNLTRSNQSNTYYVKALRVVNLSPPPSKAASPSAASGNWASFWESFQNAARKRDRVAIKAMMVANFQYGQEELSREKAIQWLSDPQVKGWSELNRILGAGTAEYKENARPARIAPPAGNKESYHGWRAVFELGKDGRWRWTAFFAAD